MQVLFKNRLGRQFLFLCFLFLLFIIVWKIFLPAVFPFPFADNITYSAKQVGLDPLLVASVMKIESNFNPMSVSPKGARGLMQIMPETAQDIASQVGHNNFSLEQLFDPKINIEMGVWYLAHLYNRFNNDIVITLAAYNAGPGQVTRWLNNEIWDGSFEHLEQIPFWETRQYVEKVVATYRVYRITYTTSHPGHM